jgi:hypothetical protein
LNNNEPFDPAYFLNNKVYQSKRRKKKVANNMFKASYKELQFTRAQKEVRLEY